MTFDVWLDTLIAEKGIDPNTVVEAEGPSGPNFIPVAAVVAAIKATGTDEQRRIKSTLVRIDVCAPGQKPVVDYLAHLAQAIAV